MARGLARQDDPIAAGIVIRKPGTRVFEQLKEAGRLLHEKWEYYDHHTVVFQPKNMTPLELQIGKIKAKSDFSKIFSIIERIMGNLRMPVYFLAANLGYRKLAIAENRIMRKSGSHQMPDSGNTMDWQLNA